MSVSAVILAAGAGTRFGGGTGGRGAPDGGEGGEREKLLAEWKGRTLIEHVIEAAATARAAKTVAEVLVVCAAGSRRIKSLATAEGCRVIIIDDPSKGISASLKAGIAALDPRAEGAVILLGDQPLVKAETIAAVVGAAQSPQALVRAHYRGNADLLSHPVYIGRNHFGLVHQATGDTGFTAVAEKHGLKWTEVWVEGHNPDVDSPIDLERLRG